MASKTRVEFNVRLVLEPKSGEVFMGFAHRLGDKRKDGSRMWLDASKTWRRKLLKALKDTEVWDAQG